MAQCLIVKATFSLGFDEHKTKVEETMPGKSKVTTDHNKIKRWTEERRGWTATVKDTGQGDNLGVLRIDTQASAAKEHAEKNHLGEFFEAFEENKLAFLYQDEVAPGGKSIFEVHRAAFDKRNAVGKSVVVIFAI